MAERPQFPTDIPNPVRDIYDNISALDFRYHERELVEGYLGENAYIRYQMKGEVALAKALARRGLGDADVVGEVIAACESVSTHFVYLEEGVIRHNVRALVNGLQRNVSERARPFIHLMATSYDILDTANSARIRDAYFGVVDPVLMETESGLILVTEREADTTQVGRTHGQHALPVTVGFATAEYVDRFGNSIEHLRDRAEEINGKFSGAVGARNAQALLIEDPKEFEEEILEEMNLKPASYSTQIVPPEPMTRFLSECVIASGVLGNLADDVRNLQRTEIGELGEAFEPAWVGSSTMVQKQNPVVPEQSKSVWKTLMGRIITVYANQISEHQRDLTGSLSSRSDVEIVAYLTLQSRRTTGMLKRMRVNPENLKKNLAVQGDQILGEPFYLLLAINGHPDAHEKMRQIAVEARQQGKSLAEKIREDKELEPYVDKFTPHQWDVLSDPTKYVGTAPQQARDIAAMWRERLNIHAA